MKPVLKVIKETEILIGLLAIVFIHLSSRISDIPPPDLRPLTCSRVDYSILNLSN
jgi:hypothetical protein